MKTIAIAGKGGTGKSTISALIILWLIEHLSTSVLAVDADSNVNLNELLGVSVKDTIGNIREEMKTHMDALPGGMTKQQFLEYKIQASLVETDNFDLVAMGRPEGPGCYCYANNLLRDILSALSTNYSYVVIDNEAGMEHLSRRTVQNIDHLILVSDPSPRGIYTAGRISALLQELDTRVQQKHLIVNRTQPQIPPPVTAAIKKVGLPLLCSVPEDKILLKADQSGKSLGSILAASSAYATIGQCLQKLLNLS
jgi:CO dehydrogenase maturation factor